MHTEELHNPKYIEESSSMKTVKGVNIYNTNITESGLVSIINIIEEEKGEEQSNRKINIGQKELLDVKMGYYLLKYDSKNAMIDDANLFLGLDEKTPEIQTPQVSGSFEKGGKQYLILFAEMNMLGQTNDYLYKGMITDINAYKNSLTNDLDGSEKEQTEKKTKEDLTGTLSFKKDIIATEKALAFEYTPDLNERERENISKVIYNMENSEYYKEKINMSRLPTIVAFDKERVIHRLGEQSILVRYDEKEQMLLDIARHKKNRIGLYNLQSPDVAGYTEYNGKHFLVLKARHELAGITNKRTYIGLIVNPNMS